MDQVDIQKIRNELDLRELQHIENFDKAIVPSGNSVEEILKPYLEAISKFNDEQKLQWLQWRPTLPEFMVRVADLHGKAVKGKEKWGSISRYLIIVSALVPPIVAIITGIASISPFATMIDAGAPAIVIFTEGNHSKWTNAHTATSTTLFPFQHLLAEIITSIGQGKYEERKKIFEEKWKKLHDTVAPYL